MASVEKVIQEYTVLIPTLIIVLITAMVAFQFIWNLFEDFLVNKLGIQTKWGRKKREEHDLLISTANGLKELSDRHDELMNTQKRISDSVEIISNKLDKMKEETDNRFQENEKWKYENEEKQNAKERNKIKAEISNRYSIYHERRCITDIEFEALQGLISSYESFGGINSFVHSKVEPEMYSWKKVSDDQY